MTWTAWGGHQAIEVEGHDVFVKRVPVTDHELANDMSTSNVFGLPSFYSYGVGSAGFGAFRELAAHQTATELVVSGAVRGFPLLHHQRLMPRVEVPPPFPIDASRYVAMWNDDPAIAHYFHARQLASHDLWLFAERIPHVVLDWFPHHLDEAARLVVQLREAATVLNAAGVVHFDAHFGNALADGAVFYLSDFGLAMSDQFDLTADERAFLDAHRDYDHAEIIWSLSQPLRTVYGSLPPEARTSVDRVLGGPMHAPSPEFLSVALDHLEAIAEQMALPAAYVDFVRRYAQVALVMDAFFTTVRAPHKGARFDQHHVAELLALADDDDR